MKQTYIHNYKVMYEENAQPGVYYLQADLNTQEAKPFFDEARNKRIAVFEDDNERHFILTHNSDGSYSLERKS
ncbi:MAG: hypothetical protein WC297_02730 [Candidatus Paceibacterota bacterium]|jgi:hypothetical protein